MAAGVVRIFVPGEGQAVFSAGAVCLNTDDASAGLPAIGHHADVSTARTHTQAGENGD